MSHVDSKAILDLPMTENDAGAATVREYFVALVREVWRHGEGFSGKRPFGNSGWDCDVYTALAEGGVIGSTRDADGAVEWTDEEEHRGDALIREAIDAMAIREAPGKAGVAEVSAPTLTAAQIIRLECMRALIDREGGPVNVDRLISDVPRLAAMVADGSAAAPSETTS